MFWLLAPKEKEVSCTKVNEKFFLSTQGRDNMLKGISDREKNPEEIWSIVRSLQHHNNDHVNTDIDIVSVTIYLYEKEYTFPVVHKQFPHLRRGVLEERIPRPVEYSFEYKLKEDWEIAVFQDFASSARRPVVQDGGFLYTSNDYGRIEVETNLGNFFIGLSDAGFAMNAISVHLSDKFDSEILARLIDDIYFQERGYHISGDYMELLSGKRQAFVSGGSYNNLILLSKHNNK